MLDLVRGRKSDADDIVEGLFPIDGSGLIVVLRCSIDASIQGEEILTVAAVGFGLDQAKAANREWESVMKGRTFHMTDLHALRKEFKGIDRSEAQEIMYGVVAVAQKAAIIAAISCNLSVIKQELPRAAKKDVESRNLLAALRSPYGYMCHMCMAEFGLLTSGNRDAIYTLEAGDDGQGSFAAYLAFALAHPSSVELRDMYSLRRYSVGEKSEIEGLFHCADLVAWEWGKQVSRQSEGKPKRKSLELIQSVQRSRFRHIPDDEIRAVMPVYRAIIEGASSAEVTELRRLWLSYAQERASF